MIISFEAKSIKISLPKVWFNIILGNNIKLFYFKQVLIWASEFLFGSPYFIRVKISNF